MEKGCREGSSEDRKIGPWNVVPYGVKCRPSCRPEPWSHCNYWMSTRSPKAGVVRSNRTRVATIKPLEFQRF